MRRHNAPVDAPGMGVLMPGASARKRVELVSGQGRQWVQITFTPDVAPEEVERYRLKLERLHRAGVPVPRVLSPAPGQRALAIEYIGDTTFDRRLGAAPAGNRFHLLLALWSTLASLVQVHDLADLPVLNASVAYRRLLFAVSALSALREDLPPPDPAVWGEIDPLAVEVDRLPRVPSHNDIHPWNLHWWENKVYLVDLDNLCLAPPHYDLVSVTEDPKFSLDQREGERLTRLAWTKLRSLGLCAPEYAQFKRECLVAGAFRHLYIAGSYAALHGKGGVVGDPIHRYLPPTLLRSEHSLRAAGLPRLAAFVGQVGSQG